MYRKQSSYYPEGSWALFHDETAEYKFCWLCSLLPGLRTIDLRCSPSTLVGFFWRTCLSGFPNFFLTPNLIFFVILNHMPNLRTIGEPLVGIFCFQRREGVPCAVKTGYRITSAWKLRQAHFKRWQQTNNNCGGIGGYPKKIYQQIFLLDLDRHIDLILGPTATFNLTPYSMLCNLCVIIYAVLPVFHKPSDCSGQHSIASTQPKGWYLEINLSFSILLWMCRERTISWGGILLSEGRAELSVGHRYGGGHPLVKTGN